VLVLVAAAFGLSLALYEDYSSSFRFLAPPVCDFSYRSVDSGKGFQQVMVGFQFDRNVVFRGLLLNGSSKGYLSLGPDGSYVSARGGIEFFSVVIPYPGQLTVSNVTSAIVDGVVTSSTNVSKGRHSMIVVSSMNYSLAAQSFSASRQSGLDPLPFMGPDDLSKPANLYRLLLPMKPGSSLTVTLLFEGGTASGDINA
jgi:hypothetical protein